MKRTPGDTAVLREIHLGRIWSARPGRMIHSDEHQKLIYFPLGTTCRWPCDSSGKDLKIPTERWELRDGLYGSESRLQFVRSGAIWTASVLRSKAGRFAGWKVDFQAPWRPTRFGFDGLDWALDVMISPDRTWHLKDEAEFATYHERGLLSDGESIAVMHALHEEVIPDLEAQRGPFHPEWARWTPKPSWTMVPLPDGWLEL